MIHLQEPACMIKGIVNQFPSVYYGQYDAALTSVVLSVSIQKIFPLHCMVSWHFYIAFTIFIQFTANYGMDNYVGIQHFRYKKDPEQMKAYLWVCCWRIVGYRHCT